MLANYSFTVSAHFLLPPPIENTVKRRCIELCINPVKIRTIESPMSSVIGLHIPLYDPSLRMTQQDDATAYITKECTCT